MLNMYDVLSKAYMIIDKSIMLLVWIGMIAVCILMWYFVFVFLCSY